MIEKKTSMASPRKKEQELVILKDIKSVSSSKFLKKNNINLVILGGKEVGKSAFVIKITKNTFEKIYIPTLGHEVKSKMFAYNTHRYKLTFTVTASYYKEDYSKIYESADFFLVFFELTNMNSFEDAKKIIQEEIKNFLANYDGKSINVILVGNKSDLNVKGITNESITKFCGINNIKYYEISVKTNRNINDMMQNLVKIYDSMAYPEE